MGPRPRPARRSSLPPSTALAGDRRISEDYRDSCTNQLRRGRKQRLGHALGGPRLGCDVGAFNIAELCRGRDRDRQSSGVEKH